MPTVHPLSEIEDLGPIPAQPSEAMGKQSQIRLKEERVIRLYLTDTKHTDRAMRPTSCQTGIMAKQDPTVDRGRAYGVFLLAERDVTKPSKLNSLCCIHLQVYQTW